MVMKICASTPPGPFEPCEQGDGRTECHQQEKQRGRILIAVDEGKDRGQPTALDRPRGGVAVDVDSAQQHEGRAGSQTEAQEPAAACEKEQGLIDITRIRPSRSHEVPRVIERHHDHHKSAQQIEGIDSGARVHRRIRRGIEQVMRISVAGAHVMYG